MHYRLYALHERSGKILSGSDILADTDDQAIAAGRQHHAHRPFELWCETRRVFTRAAG
jgi:hypothetical protein